MDENQRKTIESYNISAQKFHSTIAALRNYNGTYDYLTSVLSDNNTVLELACGPAQISKNLMRYRNIPDGVFKRQSIIAFHGMGDIDVIVNGFGIPYLNAEQVRSCFQCSYDALVENGYMYISFMDGRKEGFEKTSFGNNELFYLFYHNREFIRNQLLGLKFEIMKEWVLDYTETDGSITNDVIMICRKLHSA